MVNWGSAPFDVGIWEGPDGSELLAVLNPGGYGEPIAEDPSRSREWRDVIDRIGRRSGAYVGYRYFGVGDRGGAPDDASLTRLEKAVSDPEGEIEVVPAPSDAFYTDPSFATRAEWPRHRGELLLPMHGTGCLTSQAALKRWNRRNEERALAAEAASVIADWLGAVPYPADALGRAWIRFLWHQHHDDVTGTSIPAAYDLTWNDQVTAANELEGRLLDALEGAAAGLDTRVEGEPIVVFNPLALPRRDVLELHLPAPADGRRYRLTGPHGQPIPSQWQPSPQGEGRLLCCPRLPSLGLVVLGLAEVDAPPTGPLDEGVGPVIDGRSIDNGRFRISIDERGRVASVLDRECGRELLAAPLELELLPDRSRRWPAWEVLWDDLASAPVERAGSRAQIRPVEAGPIRATLEVTRSLGRSRVVERVSLAAGPAGDRVEWWAEIDWRERKRLLKARFSLATAAPTATFDLGLGAIRRGNATAEAYEVPAQQWVDLTNAEGTLGVTALSECRLGWNKPDDGTLRLSLLRSPRARWRFRHQATQDHGRHRMGWALYGHRGVEASAQAAIRAARFTCPPLAFHARPHGGPLGRTFGFLDLEGSGDVAVQALKRSEDGEDVVLRVRETAGGQPAPLVARFPRSLISVRRASGTETPAEEVESHGGDLVDRVRPFSLATYRLRIEPPEEALSAPVQAGLALPLDTPAVSFHDAGGPVAFDRSGRSLPGELLPPAIEVAGVRLELGEIRPGASHCLSCRGQHLELPGLASREGSCILLLTASTDGDRQAVFTLETPTGSRAVSLLIPSWRAPLAQRARREAEPRIRHRERIAWVATHRHDRRLRDEPYHFGYLFAHRLDAPAGARRLLLPDDSAIRLFALTVADGGERRLEPIPGRESRS
jgi:alpha-mannosidase